MQNETQTTAVTPFRIAVPEEEIPDLHTRLDRIRWPEKGTVANWSQGVPLAEMRKLVDYWRRDYDWRHCETALNSYPQFTTELDGLGIHFLHIRSSGPEPIATVTL